jgi:ABC-type glutathione transport system ATPase component
MAILTAANITKTFPVESGLFRSGAGVVKALDNVSIAVEPSQVLGVVGESGSGKTTLGKILCGLLQPDHGVIVIEGRPIGTFKPAELATKIQMVFQDPFMSLNPKLSVRTILSEAAFHLPRQERAGLIEETLDAVGLPQNILSSYPHQFSGGQRQRIAISRALIKRPKVIVADEPLSALDLTTQNQLLALFDSLKTRFGISFVFISHDLSVTGELSDQLIVMQNGKIVEGGPTREVMAAPKEEYTRRLLAAVPKMG